MIFFKNSLWVSLFISLFIPSLHAQWSGADPIWRQALGGKVLGAPTAQVESVAAACDGGSVQVYGRQGKLLWKYTAPGRLSPFISRSREGTSYFCRTNGTFIAVNRSGRELWRTNMGAPLTAPVLVGWDGRVFVPTAKRILCYTAAGYVLWSRSLPRPLAMAPAPDKQGGLVMVLDNGELFGLDPFGQPYSRKLPSLPAAMAPLDNAPAGPAEAPGNGPAILVVYKTGEAETLRWNRETADWSALPFPALEATPLALINRGDKIAAAMANGRITLRSLDGQILWAEESHISAGDTATEAAMVYDEWGIYTFTQSGATGYSEGGKQLWTLRIQGAAGLPALGEEGILYSGGEDWILYAYHVEDRIRAEKQSFYGPVPKGSYGGENPRPSPWVTYDYPFGGEAVSAQLGIITKAIRAGRVGEHEKNYAAYLMEIAGSTAEALRTGNANQPSAQVNHRIEAAQLLAYIGSRDTIPFLAYLCQTDPDALVQSAAAEAIGRIGVDPDGNAFRAFSALIFPLSTKKDPRLLASIAAATGSICRFSGPPLSYAGIKLLAALAGAGSPSLAQRAAQQELRSLLY